MAKTGYSISQLMSIDIEDINSMKTSDLAKIVQQLADAGNKRLKRLATSGNEDSFAYKSAMESGGRFSISGQRANQGKLKSEFVRVRNFLQAKTSTVKGWKNEIKNVVNRLSNSESVSIPKKNIQEYMEDVENRRFYWNAYNEIRKNYVDLDSTRIQQMLSQTIIKHQEITSMDEIVKMVDFKIQQAYESGFTLSDEELDEEFYNSPVFEDYDDEGDGEWDF